MRAARGTCTSPRLRNDGGGQIRPISLSVLAWFVSKVNRIATLSCSTLDETLVGEEQPDKIKSNTSIGLTARGLTVNQTTQAGPDMATACHPFMFSVAVGSDCILPIQNIHISSRLQDCVSQIIGARGWNWSCKARARAGLGMGIVAPFPVIFRPWTVTSHLHLLACAALLGSSPEQPNATSSREGALTILKRARYVSVPYCHRDTSLVPSPSLSE